ncbi:hypothetical protein ASPSYDRAFT_794435 [Aspergillus sydowii CBS 593.65]|uniref:Uncharacterized protein n=1 Tax=Aspergillus sydowii CBS 593.65 TaxID=1036612 RepID=A0A1L9TNZ6_9EURO|nr:uncharacterized protein ASPSYDRAFT_794435 [Aspergillus sydowii CBS 593.65]OJJ61144.1 hypothetical protein ASPSYDRAFT_794435 [Aspergillus sydowii CBS 593.65]
MRVTALPIFLYSLSLVAVVAGQSAQVTDTGLSDITDALPTPTETSATDTNSDASTTETEDPTSTSTEEPTSTPSATSTSDEEDTSTTTTEDPTTTTDDPTSTADDSTTTADPTTTTTSASNDDEPSTTKTPTVSTITTTQTINGTPVPTTFTSTDAASESTQSPGLSGSSSDDSDSGLDSSQKKIIIGVVVGVGGAILIGAIGVVVWRIRARRRAAGEDDATDLMSGTAVGSGVREKAPSPAAGGTPFRSTLDQYHNPGPVNAASNF